MALVELFALPGAGKTTIADAVAEQSSVTTRHQLSNAWADNPRTQRAALIARAMINPAQLMAATRFAAHAKLKTRESAFRLARLMAKREWLRSHSGPVLLDQGFLQDLWSILVSGNSKGVDARLLSELIGCLYDGLDVKIAILEIDPETAAARIGSRDDGQSRFDGLPQAELRQSLACGGGLYDDIVEAASRAGLQLVRLDGRLPPEDLAAELRSLFPVELGNKDRSDQPQPPRRISVVGASGSGKTFLANELAKRLSLPLFELDELRWAATDRDQLSDSFRKRITEITRSGEWIIDGHYRDVRQLVWSRADVVVWLNYSLAVVGSQLLGRFRRNRRSTNGSTSQLNPSAPGTYQRTYRRASWKRRFARFTRTLRERREYGRLLRSPEYSNLRIIELRSVRAKRRWLRSLERGIR